jgi:hypothetical protein
MGFLLGFVFGIIFTLAATPLIFKWWINRKINKLTGGLLK